MQSRILGRYLHCLLQFALGFLQLSRTLISFPEFLVRSRINRRNLRGLRKVRNSLVRTILIEQEGTRSRNGPES